MASMYDREMVKPMWMELERIGIEPITTPDKVDKLMAEKDGTTLMVVNSVCGCAAGSARPGVAIALQNEVIPDRLATVFAGVDMEATEQARKHIVGVKPSSPSVALFKDGELVFVLERHQIEGRSDQDIADDLKKAFNEHCKRKGPSVPWEQVLDAFQARQG